MLKRHLSKISGLDENPFDESGNLTTFCGRWTAPLNNQEINLVYGAAHCTCAGCIRTKQFRALSSEQTFNVIDQQS